MQFKNIKSINLEGNYAIYIIIVQIYKNSYTHDHTHNLKKNQKMYGIKSPSPQQIFYCWMMNNFYYLFNW